MAETDAWLHIPISYIQPGVGARQPGEGSHVLAPTRCIEVVGCMVCVCVCVCVIITILNMAGVWDGFDFSYLQWFSPLCLSLRGASTLCQHAHVLTAVAICSYRSKRRKNVRTRPAHTLLSIAHKSCAPSCWNILFSIPISSIRYVVDPE
jgi:hypothetical protein